MYNRKTKVQVWIRESIVVPVCSHTQSTALSMAYDMPFANTWQLHAHFSFSFYE